eukprot:tig00021122_g18447.t1
MASEAPPDRSVSVIYTSGQPPAAVKDPSYEQRAFDADRRTEQHQHTLERARDSTVDHPLRPGVAIAGSEEAVSESPRSSSLETFVKFIVPSELESSASRAPPSEIESSDVPSPTSTDSSRRLLGCDICGRECLTTQALISHRKSCEQRLGTSGISGQANTTCPPFGATKVKPARAQATASDGASAAEQCAATEEDGDGAQRRLDGDEALEGSECGAHEFEAVGENSLGSSADAALPFVCQRCGKAFTTIFGLGRHNGWCPLRPGVAPGAALNALPPPGPAVAATGPAVLAGTKKPKKGRWSKEASPTSASLPPPSPSAVPSSALPPPMITPGVPPAASAGSPRGGPLVPPNLAPELIAAISRAGPAVRCDACGKVFGSAQGLGQHRRHCAGTSPVQRGRKGSEGEEESALSPKPEPGRDEAHGEAADAARCPHCRKRFGSSGSLRRHLSRCPRLRAEGAGGSEGEQSEAESMEAPLDVPEPPIKEEASADEAGPGGEALASSPTGREAARERARGRRSGFACAVCGRTLMTRSGLVIHERHCKGPADEPADEPGPAPSPSRRGPLPPPPRRRRRSKAGRAAGGTARRLPHGARLREPPPLVHRALRRPRFVRQRGDKQAASPPAEARASEATTPTERESERSAGTRSLTCSRCKKTLISVQGLVIHVKFCKGGEAAAAPPPRRRVRNQKQQQAREGGSEDGASSGGSGDETPAAATGSWQRAASRPSALSPRDAADADAEEPLHGSPPGSPSAGAGLRSPFSCEPPARRGAKRTRAALEESLDEGRLGGPPTRGGRPAPPTPPGPHLPPLPRAAAPETPSPTGARREASGRRRALESPAGRRGSGAAGGAAGGSGDADGVEELEGRGAGRRDTRGRPTAPPSPSSTSPPPLARRARPRLAAPRAGPRGRPAAARGRQRGRRPPPLPQRRPVAAGLGGPAAWGPGPLTVAKPGECAAAARPAEGPLEASPAPPPKQPVSLRMDP